jgi:NTE family protein
MTPEEVSAWELFLAGIPIFSGLSKEELRKIAQKMQLLSLPKGATLFRQGDEPDDLFIIASGLVRVVHLRGNEEVVDAFLGRGETLGEGGVLTGERRTASVQLVSTCEFLKLPRQDFHEILRENPSISIHLTHVLTKRLIQTTRGTPKKLAESTQFFAFYCACDTEERHLLSVHLGLQLLEQTRRRVLLIDMNPDAGAIAQYLGFKSPPVTRQLLLSMNLRDPGRIRTLSQQHASGLEVLSIPAENLSGSLLSGIYLFVNFLRETHDLVLVSLSGPIGPVEEKVLLEADKVVLLGSISCLSQYRKLEEEFSPLVPESRLLRAWCGDNPPEDVLRAGQGRDLVIPWNSAIKEKMNSGFGIYESLETSPKTRSAIERLARRLGHIRIGLACGSGAALGYSIIGILKVFKREGIPIDLVSGTSMGALIGGLAAVGMEPEEMENVALRIDKFWMYSRLFLDLSVPRSGIFSGGSLLNLYRSLFGQKKFSDCEIPFACVATDIETGEEIVINEGNLAEAVRASSSLPVIFEPYLMNGRYLIDGGLVNPVPVRVVSDQGADVLISINLTLPASSYTGKKNHDPEVSETPAFLGSPSLARVFFHMIYTAEYEIAKSRSGLSQVVIQPDIKGFSWSDLHRAREIIRAGEEAAEKQVPFIKALIPYFADRCQVPLRLASAWR